MDGGIAALAARQHGNVEVVQLQAASARAGQRPGHRVRRLDPRDVTTYRGIPTTSHCLLVDPTVLEHAIALHTSGSAGTRSRGEDAFLALLERDLPEPLVNTDLLGYEVDCRWPDLRLRRPASDRRSGGGLFAPVLVQAPVGPSEGEKLFVGALFDDPAVFEDDDLARPLDRRQPVGDDDRGAAREQPPQAGLDPRLGVDVDVGGRLVQDRMRGSATGRARRRPAAAGRRRAARRARRPAVS